MLPRMPTAILLVGAAAIASCSGDDSANDGAGDGVGSTATIEFELPPTTTLVARVAGDRCEAEPEPADYLDGPVPTAIRPCQVPTQLTVHTVREGTGTPANPGDSVVYHYTRIRSADGALIDSSYIEGVPVNLPVVGRGGDIEGLDDSLVGVRAGQLLRLDIPAPLAYGDTPPAEGDGTIRAGDALTYVVDVQAVIPVVVPEDAPLDLVLEPSIGALAVTTKDLVVGEGRPAEVGTTVVLNMLLVRGDNEVVLFNTWAQRSPLVITLDPALMTGPEPATIPGIFEGIQGASPGTRRVITMPPAEAFGQQGEPRLGLPADTDVIVIADVLGVY